MRLPSSMMRLSSLLWSSPSLAQQQQPPTAAQPDELGQAYPHSKYKVQMQTQASKAFFDNPKSPKKAIKRIISLTIDSYAKNEELIARLKNIKAHLSSSSYRSQVIMESHLFDSNPSIALSPIALLSYADLVRHLDSLRTDYVQKYMRGSLQRLLHHPRNANVFNEPVDPVALKIPDYAQRVPLPMDLGTVRKKVTNYEYDDIISCAGDVNLTFDNAMAYNSADHIVHQVRCSALLRQTSPPRPLTRLFLSVFLSFFLSALWSVLFRWRRTSRRSSRPT